MIPDPATVSRRRHVATMLARAGLLVWGVWLVARVSSGIWTIVPQVLRGATFFDSFLYVFIGILDEVTVWLAAFFLHGRLIRWVVPMGKRTDLCPSCGYSLKNLEGPVCPECGMNLGGATAGPAAVSAPAATPAAPATRVAGPQRVPTGARAPAKGGELLIPPPPGHG